MLDDSLILAFFVSPESLNSTWCKFELDEAELRMVRGTLRRSLAVFVGEPLDPAVLPAWLARVKAVHHDLPAQCAREITALLNRVVPEQHNPFVGRHEDVQRGVRKLAAGNPTPRLLVATGLDGIGRRSYLGQVVNEGLSLTLGPVISLTATDSVEDLYLASASHITLLTRAQADAQLNAFRELTHKAQAEEVAGQLEHLAQGGSAPCIVDRGSMLDNDGAYRSEYAQVLKAFLAHDDVYLCLTHRRSPQYRDLSFSSMFLERRLRPIDFPDAQALIGRLLRDGGVKADSGKTGILAEGTAGYPPAAYYLASQVETYGIDVVLSDRSRLNDFQNGSFSRFVLDLDLTDVQREVLIYLASESHLPLAGIAAAVGHAVWHDPGGSVRCL